MIKNKNKAKQKSLHMNWLCLVLGEREGVGVWQMRKGDVSHIPASVISIRMNSLPKGINNEFYLLEQVDVRTLETSDTSSL